MSMARQSQPNVLLTRPLAQSQRFSQGMDANITISPLMQAEFLEPAIPQTAFAAVVFTSETGVTATARLKAAGIRFPLTAYCVGARTATAARQNGWTPICGKGGVSELAEMIVAQQPQAKLLLCRPEDEAGDLAKHLTSAGIETFSAVVYRQRPLGLTQAAQALLCGNRAVFVPLFSPRSARLFSEEYRRFAGTAPLYIVAISAAVIAELSVPAQDIIVADHPDAEAMRRALSQMTQRVLGA